ncbi:MAG: Putative metal chaperone YciC [Acidimicrobiales bacterium AG-410-I20]|nr:MAG: Putative metal chaperone YciC [Acidimicrobiales bacterium AG-410-I20]
MSEKNLPLTVIGGYLGAGKTTLINDLLTNSDIGRVAIIVNDFGEINIDESLILSHDGDTISLANGCICCSLVDGFAETLTQIKDRSGQIDRVVIEVSGVGEPRKIAQWGHTPGFSLDGVVVLVDPCSVIERSEDSYVGETVCSQIMGADLILLSRCDLLEEQEIKSVETWLKGLTQASVLRNPVSPSLLFGLDKVGQEQESSSIDHVSATFEFSDSIDLAALTLWEKSRPTGVVRVKGFLKINDRSEEITEIQMCGPNLTLRASQSKTQKRVLVAIATPRTPKASVVKWLKLLSPAK